MLDNFPNEHCKAEFSASLLQSSVSHDPSEIILKCWCAETFLIIINVENSCAAQKLRIFFFIIWKNVINNIILKM